MPHSRQIACYLQPSGASDSQLISTTDAAANRRVEIDILQRLTE